ncbi:low temperature requirement protein A [Streptomyces acidiscabies]|uniref:low temperature requirement protein A n=1 Tax=Streptomyces acidiscabies TaxID=42234 RepID=UPI0038F70023
MTTGSVPPGASSGPSDVSPGAHGSPRPGRPVRRLTARGRDEAHRGASPLELFFDLCFVVAVAQAGVVMVVAELSVPVFAERDFQTAWHPHHIAAGGLLIVFAAWWISFVVPVHGHLRSNRQAFPWGYGHCLVFASAAAIGAGLEVGVEEAVGKARISAVAAAATVTVPTALYLVTVRALHSRHFKVGLAQQAVLPGAAVLTARTAAREGRGVVSTGRLWCAGRAPGEGRLAV